MGAFNRRVEVVTRELGEGRREARAVVEDDYHHFRVILRAQDGRVVEAISEPVRTPNSVCPSAGERLSDLVGMALNPASASVMEATDPRQQCTHQIDLAGVAVAALAAGRPRRVYDVHVPDRVDGLTTAVLRRDGEVVLQWEMDGDLILGPAPYAQRSLGTGFTGFARTLPTDEGEAALVLRRAAFVSQARGVMWDSKRLGPVGACFAWQPERIDLIQRQPGAIRDYTARAEELARDDQPWLAFEA